MLDLDNGGFTARNDQLNTLTELFRAAYNNYVASITVVNNGVEQALPHNPAFALPNPGLRPILTTPFNWFVLVNLAHPIEIIWDPMMFTFANHTPSQLVDFAAITRNTPIHALTAYNDIRDHNWIPLLAHPFIDQPLHPFNIEEAQSPDSVEEDQDQDEYQDDPDPDF